MMFLEIEDTANYDGFDYDYDFEVIDSPNELRDLILKKIKSTTNPDCLQDTAGNGKRKAVKILISMI